MRHGAGLCQDFFRKNPRQLVLADHHFHVHAEVVGRAQHLDHAAHRRLRGRGPAGNLHIDDQAFQAFAAHRILESRDGFGSQHAIRRFSFAHWRNFLPLGNQNRLCHAVVEGNDEVASSPARARIMKNADDGGVVPLDHADNAAKAAAIGLGRLHIDQHLVALHRAVDLVGRNKNVFAHARNGRLPAEFAGRLARVGTDKTVAVAMQIEPPGGQIVARAACGSAAGDGPVFPVHLGQRATRRHARQLLQQQTPLAAAAEREFAHQLLVSGFAAG